MERLTRGAAERRVAGDGEDRVGARRGTSVPSADHLRRLCASLGEATRLVSSPGGVVISEGPAPCCPTHSLDVLAFAMAVDAVLFLDAVREGAPLSCETRAWLGQTLTAIDRLLHFLDLPQERGPLTVGIGGSLRDARENLGKTAKGLRTRLAAHCGFRVVAEFRSGSTDARCAT